ncbi:MAG: hypothetical protein V7K97_12950 [Nostoc sp.]|uniref:hypothetical protein n=1 Tax=Nostoc sp. TaxID=1180 RepID=UPI002FF76DF4
MAKPPPNLQFFFPTFNDAIAYYVVFDTPSPKGTGILEESKSELSMVLAKTP